MTTTPNPRPKPDPFADEPTAYEILITEIRQTRAVAEATKNILIEQNVLNERRFAAIEGDVRELKLNRRTWLDTTISVLLLVGVGLMVVLLVFVLIRMVTSGAALGGMLALLRLVLGG